MIIMIVIVIVIGTWEADCFAKLGDFHRVPGTHQVYDAENYDDDEKEDNNDEKENNNDNDDDEKEDDDDDDDVDDTGLVWEGSQHRRCWSWCWEGWGGRERGLIMIIAITIIMTSIMMLLQQSNRAG